MGNKENIAAVGVEAVRAVSQFSEHTLTDLEKILKWISTPRGQGKDFEEAIEIYKKNIEADERIPVLMKSAMISKARKTLKEYCNQKDILEIAEKFLTGKEEIKNLDDDWLSFFMDKAKNINNDDIKLMFGKILAGEASGKAHIPKRLIQTLEIMEEYDAKNFKNLCRSIIRISAVEIPQHKMVPMIDLDNDTMLGLLGLTVSNLMDLKAIGLIEFNSERPFIFRLNPTPYNSRTVIKYGESERIVNLQELEVGHVAFTKAGEKLASLLEEQAIKEYEIEIEKYYRRRKQQKEDNE